MPHTFTCVNGHFWESDQTDVPCPVCGSTADSLNLEAASTWEADIADELPPPPGASVRSLTTSWPADTPPDFVPVVPGYEITGELGRGGMGVVYEARHLALNRRVALKVIRGGGFAGKDEAARFRAEAEAVARLQHPNIVQIYEVGEHAGLPYLALEFVDGGSLAAQLRRAPLDARPAAGLVATLARAVQHAHSRGVVHRDLKPANVLLEAAAPTPKVGDFGLAKLADDPGRSRSGQIVGTPAYMAPEQAAGRGDLVGPPADVWSLGAILYECLTGRPPFLGATSIETVQMVLTTEPAAPSSFKPGIPRDLETICLKCLRKEAEGRYRTAGDLADDLKRFQEGRPVVARRTPMWERLVKWARRRPAAAALVAVSLLAAAAFAWLGYRHFRDLGKYNRDLEAKNATITQNNVELEARNVTITQKTHDLEAANVATTRERDRAEGNLLEAIDAIDRMLSDMGLSRVAHIPHLDKTRAAMVEEALQLCDRLIDSQAYDSRLRLLQALTLQRSGYMLSLLQRYKEADDRFARALAIIHEHSRDAREGASPEDFVKVETITRLDRGKLYVRQGDAKRGKEEYDAAMALVNTTRGLTNPELKFLLAVGNANLAVIAADQRELDRAILHLGRARQYLEELFVEDSRDAAYVCAYAFVLNLLGKVYLDKNDTDRAAELFEKGVGVSRRLVAASPANPDYREELARCLSNYAATLRIRGYLKRAAEPLAESLAIREELARDHPEIASFVIDLCWGYYQTGRLHQDRNDSGAAAEWFTKAIDRLTKEPGILKQEVQARTLISNVYHTRAAALEQLKRDREGIDDLAKAIEFAVPERLQTLRVQRALLLLKAGKRVEALKEVEGALALQQEASPEVRFDVGLLFARAARGNTEQAEEFARRAVKELATAQEAGYFRDPKQRKLLDDSEFMHLRGRDDFEALRAKSRRP